MRSQAQQQTMPIVGTAVALTGLTKTIYFPVWGIIPAVAGGLLWRWWLNGPGEEASNAS